MSRPSAGTRVRTGSATPTVASFLLRSTDHLAEDSAIVALAGGKAHLAAITTEGDHGAGVLRASVDGVVVDLFRFQTGGCGGGTIIELAALPDGSAIRPRRRGRG